MGRKSRAKRERREQTDFTAALTACAGTWLERPPTPEEQKRLDDAFQELKKHRAEADALAADAEAANRFSIEMFRAPIFAPLQFDDWMIETGPAQPGEPPVVEEEGDTAFSDWLR